MTARRTSTTIARPGAGGSIRLGAYLAFNREREEEVRRWATDAFVLLQRLRCLLLKATESRTEPYIWPVLVQIDDNTLATPELVAVVAPALGNARVKIKDSMRVGETADIPTSVGRPDLQVGRSASRAIEATVVGEIVSDCRVENGTFKLSVTTPPGTTATVVVPGEGAVRTKARKSGDSSERSYAVAAGTHSLETALGVSR